MEVGTAKIEGCGEIRRTSDGGFIQAFAFRRVEFGKLYVALYEKRINGRLLRVFPREAVEVKFTVITETDE